eukprot:7377887-Prymnesium_polylepis.1
MPTSETAGSSNEETGSNRRKKSSKGLLPDGKRLRPDQVEALERHKDNKRVHRNAAHKKASLALQEAQCTARQREPGFTAKAIVERVNSEAALTPRSKLTASGIKQHVANGKAGISPKAPGPPPQLPKELFRAAGVRAQLLQIAGQEQSTAKIAASMLATLDGNELVSLLNTKGKRRNAIKKVKQMCHELATKTKKTSEDRRVEWLTVSNVVIWFQGYVACLQHHGFIEPKPDDPLFIPLYKLRRMSNSDETHHKLSNEGDKGGSRANVLVNPALGRCGNR